MSKARVTTVLVLLLVAAAHAAVARQSGAGALRRVALPDKDWALDVSIPFEVGPAVNQPPGGAPKLLLMPVEHLSDDGRGYTLYLMRGPDKKHPSEMLSVRIELRPAQAAGGAEEFRAFTLKTLSRDGLVKGLKTSEYKQIPIARYRFDLNGPGGGPWGGAASVFLDDIRTAEAFLVRDDVWVSVKFIARDFGEAEERQFRSLLDSVRFVDTSAPSTSFDFYNKGRLHRMRKEHRRAAEALASAFEMEKRGRRLDTASWRDLVINLVDSYAAGHDLARAKETLDFAVAEDPTNPDFHMALARYHALRDDLDNTLASLEKAFLGRKNGTPAAPIPDLARDPAFERFRKDERFRKALKAMKK